MYRIKQALWVSRTIPRQNISLVCGVLDDVGPSINGFGDPDWRWNLVINVASVLPAGKWQANPLTQPHVMDQCARHSNPALYIDSPRE